MVSKLSAIMDLGIKSPFRKDDKALYLGASHGVTALLISEMVGEKGFVFCVEFSKDSMKELLPICEEHSNMAPLLYDAGLPELYKNKVCEVDVIYRDIAQRNQSEILKQNAGLFLKKGGYVVFIVKTQSIDAVKEPSEVLEELKKNLAWLEIEHVIDLDKTHAKHYAIIGKKK
ncbi:MAG: fibrillarin-like rRNA/tRNA 2'-O-methyltransferase [Nanoarchaeota archaeon]